MHSHHAQHLKDKHKQTQTGRNWLDAISDNLYPPPDDVIWHYTIIQTE